MKPYIKLTFGTTDKDLVLNIPNALTNVQASVVTSAMNAIKNANIIDGVASIVKNKSAAFCQITTKEFDLTVTE